jgi:hypothetical protein
MGQGRYTRIVDRAGVDTCLTQGSATKPHSHCPNMLSLRGGKTVLVSLVAQLVQIAILRITRTRRAWEGGASPLLGFDGRDCVPLAVPALHLILILILILILVHVRCLKKEVERQFFYLCSTGPVLSQPLHYPQSDRESLTSAAHDVEGSMAGTLSFP